ncbi:MAG: hypothetical protein J6M62_03765 [Selenomonadaceae bacterium]|nr:hypothetical protein [Selenomonadaceae bacterium]MBP3721704.1 hypothetical protein [Selenomonadaceae bacterium]
MDSRIYSSNMQVAKVFSNIQKKLASNLENISYKSVLEKEIDTFSEKSSEDMTIEEYKAYIWDRIDSFPFSPTRPYDDETIKISEKCFERMKEDFEYEEKMMNIIKEGRMYPNPYYGSGLDSGGVYWILEFDGGEGCKSQGFSKNFGGSKETASDRFDKESDGGFWSSKRLLKKKMQAEIEEIIHKKREMIQEINEEIALTREIKIKQSIMENAPELPITGVPAKYLLAGLPSLPTVSV